MEALWVSSGSGGFVTIRNSYVGTTTFVSYLDGARSPAKAGQERRYKEGVLSSQITSPSTSRSPSPPQQLILKTPHSNTDIQAQTPIKALRDVSQDRNHLRRHRQPRSQRGPRASLRQDLRLRRPRHHAEPRERLREGPRCPGRRDRASRRQGECVSRQGVYG